MGEPKIPSPVELVVGEISHDNPFVEEEDRVLLSPYFEPRPPGQDPDTPPLTYEVAGPRRMLFFEPANVRAAIVTCGGLCPGINDVVRRLVLALWYNYGVREIFGIRYGYRGLVEGEGEVPYILKPEEIETISNDGGTYLGSSRGNQDPVDMVDFLQRRKIQILFTIGGDGTQRGAMAISREARKRGYALSVVGIPKTIDNDIGLVERTFGFDTAVSLAAHVLRGAHVEAEAEHNGVVIVKIMGRQSGFLATQASIASGDVNFLLVPEVPFELDGPKGFLYSLKRRLELRHHALVVVAEGCAEQLMTQREKDLRWDDSGNLIFEDVGVYLKTRIAEFMKEVGLESKVRYIDPSYYVRSLPAVPSDSIFCQQLANFAVHAAMSGRTELIVATCNGVPCHIPLEAATIGRRHVELDGPLWRSALETTGQPARMMND
ncbi:MAG: ATP-dependent 6-phosphofructokinase [Candidatus Omnitrophica bacterium]|nr:ATP-dependent 6-phosphofructokinase [Candidatus Omnitrophota bacterium]MCA9435732.1 ATP-dependent 6-phosphofructokinase [Candidatus Omnitrophota bacterium]